MKTKLKAIDVTSALMLNQFTLDEVKCIIQAAIIARDTHSRAAARAMSVGDMVEFEDKRGNVYRGKVLRINPKMTKVRTLTHAGLAGPVYNVSHTLLKRIS